MSRVTPPSSAQTLPSTEVPTPKGIIGTPWAAQMRTIPATSSVVSGKATASGGRGAW